MRGFGSVHPAVLFLYYALALGFSMVSMHPVLIGASLTGGFLLFWAQNGLRKLFSELAFFLVLILVMSLVNPLFVHNGETVLFFLNGQAITLEAAAYGCMASLMVASVLLWCRCYGAILTTDKFLYLFGKLIPKLGLLLSMTFRFIPLFKAQIGKIGQVQKTMGMFASESLTDRIRSGIRVFESLVSWSMENSIDTADAMKARGYGLPHRTNFTLFQFRKRDGILLGILAALSLGILASFLSGGFDFYYYPTVAPLSAGAEAIFRYSLVFAFMCIPGFMEWREKVSWNYLKSKI